MSYWELMQLKEIILILNYERKKDLKNDSELLDWFIEEVMELIK